MLPMGPQYVRLIVLALLVACIAVTPFLANAQTCAYEENVEYAGGDLGTATIKQTKEDCCRACAANSACKVWTWKPKKFCYLKGASNSINYITSSGAYSGWPPGLGSCTTEYAVEYAGGDVKSVVMYKGSSSLCCNWCKLTPSCKLWTWKSSLRSCYLKSPSTSMQLYAGSSASTSGWTSSSYAGNCAMEIDTDFPGYDFKSALAVPSETTCCNWCNLVSTCILWVYNKNTKVCYLKSGGSMSSNRMPATGAIAGWHTGVIPPTDNRKCKTVASTRAGIVKLAMDAVNSGKTVTYTQNTVKRWSGINSGICPSSLPPYADCSSFATWVYWTAFGKTGDYLSDTKWTSGATSTMELRGTKRSSIDYAQPGDLVFFSDPPHVAIYVGNVNGIHMVAGMGGSEGNVRKIYYRTLTEDKSYHKGGITSIRSYDKFFA